MVCIAPQSIGRMRARGGERYSRQDGQMNEDRLTENSVFKWRLKVGSDLVSRILTGNEFQTLGAENRKARDPKVKLWLETVILKFGSDLALKRLDFDLERPSRLSRLNGGDSQLNATFSLPFIFTFTYQQYLLSLALALQLKSFVHILYVTFVFIHHYWLAKKAFCVLWKQQWHKNATALYTTE